MTKMTKKTLFIIRGIPGSGKSTAAELLADTGIATEFGEPTEKYPVCTADDYFMRNGEYKWDPAKIGAAHKSCQHKCRTAMKNNCEKIFVANTSTTEKELKPYYEMAEEFGYMVVSLIVENRHGGKNVHNVPEETITKMKSRFDIKL